MEVMNNSFYKGMQPRLEEYDPVKPDCYQLIFEPAAACIGPRFKFTLLGSTFMISAKKQVLSLYSKDTLFTELMTVGMSIHYPHLIDLSNCWQD
ncbi:unnamed protein product [Allacma fusca]|uniref:Uncharacterized protein n=1 Tax=Allacma fusca TaxID=39272 RepID=A0A8J2KDN5_9HEXA|nr:unnamed protein product [Allacma fusca]